MIDIPYWIFRFIRMCLSIIISVVFFPYTYFFTDKNLWLFSGINGKYIDNCRYLYEYVRENVKDVHAIWITTDKECATKMKDSSLDAEYAYTLQAFIHILHASVLISSIGNLEFGVPIYGKRKIYLQTWHGTMLKVVGPRSFRKDGIMYIITKAYSCLKKIIINQLNKHTLGITTSSIEFHHYSELFSTTYDNIYVTGYPRNDILLKSKSKILNCKKCKKILFAPTYNTAISESLLHPMKIRNVLAKLNKMLHKQNAFLFAKIHPQLESLRQVKDKYAKYDRIIFLSARYDIYRYMHDFDILITDYSGIYFDFLLLNKPIIFTPFDLEKYKNSRGIHFNYDLVTPGPKATNWDELIKEIKDVLDGKDEYKEKRRCINNMFNEVQDARSSERIIGLINKKVNE